MRIAYASLHWPRTRSSNIGKKIARQIKAWQEADHEVRFFMHTHPYPGDTALLEGEIFEYHSGTGILRKAQRELSRSAALKKMLAAVAGYRPDLIYMRMDYYAFPAHRLFRIAPVVIEVNSLDISEHLLWSRMLGAYNLITRRLILSRPAGLVYVSHELAGHQAFSSFAKPTKVIANGIDLKGIEPLPAPHNDNPRLVFMAGELLPWHGVDKLLELAERFPDITIDVIGSLPAPGKRPSNVTFHGYLEPADYLKLFARADAAAGTLALHRKGMEEASPLKTREYLACGLPLIIAYRDTDLDDLACDCFLKIPNREDNIQTHGTAIHDFACRMRGRRVDRELIAQRIDAGPKEEARFALFEKIVSRHEPRYPRT